MSGPRYVYAVCRPLDAPLQAQLTGVAGAPPALLRHHGLVAVVSTVPEAEYGERALRAHLADPDWLATTTRAHRGVIDALTTVTTPVPLRPATVFPDDSGVRSMIEAREAEFRRVLDRLHDRVEWRVRLYAATEASGRAEDVARSLHDELARHAEDSRRQVPRHPEPSPAPERLLLDAAYLVPRAHSEEFVERVRRRQHQPPGTRTELDGPSAAYSFTEEEPPRP